MNFQLGQRVRVKSSGGAWAGEVGRVAVVEGDRVTVILDSAPARPRAFAATALENI